MELPFESLAPPILQDQRSSIQNYIQGLKTRSQGDQVLKLMMLDLLKLQFRLEDILRLIKQLSVHLEYEEEKKTVVNAARQNISSICAVNQLGTAWLENGNGLDQTILASASTSGKGGGEKAIGPDADLGPYKWLSWDEVKIDLEETGFQFEEETPSFDTSNISNFPSLTVKEENLQGVDLPNQEIKEDHKEFQCQHCELDFSSKFQLFKHKKNVHEESYYSCKECSYTSVLKSTLRQHVQHKHKEGLSQNKKKIHFCVDCDFVGPTHKKLLEHRKKLHKNYSCEFCEFSTKDYKCLKKHTERVHGTNKQPCEFCSYEGTNEMCLKRHIKIYHPDFSNPSWTKCAKCTFLAETTEHMKTHIESQHCTESLCEECDFVGKTKAKLKQHIQNCHSEVIYRCDQCVYSTKSKSNLRLHEEARHMNNMYLCDQCDYIGKTTLLLQRHIKYKHDGVSFPCDQCNYVGASLVRVKSHKETQHEPPKFFCDKCEYSATLAKFLQAHIESAHEKIRYPCNLCDHASTSQGNLRQHKRRVHKLEPKDTFD